MKKLWLVLASIILSLLIVELAARLFFPHTGVLPFGPHHPDGLLTYHPTRYYAYTPGFVGTVDTEEYHTDIRINALGLRDEEVDPDSGVDVLAAGNSFTAGHGVQADETWSAQLESAINSSSMIDHKVRVLNAAISGYSLTQISLLIDDLLYLKPKLVVLGLYPSADLRRHDPYVYHGGRLVVRSMKPHLKPGKDAFYYSPYKNSSIRNVHFWFMKNWHFAAYILNAVHNLKGGSSTLLDQRFSSDDDKVSLLDDLKKINEQLADEGVGLIVLLVTHQNKNGSFSSLQSQYNSAVKDYCSSKGITFFDPLPLFKSKAGGKPVFRIGKDHHWSKSAHALVGRELAEFMLEQQWIIKALSANE